MEDILFSYPEFCGENDCPVGVHLYHVWAYFKGRRTTYSVCDTDGNHDYISSKDVRGLEKDLQRLWREYAAHVAREGEDPLGEFFIKPTYKRRERWQLRYRNSILGPILAAARRSGSKDWTAPAKVPKDIQDFATVSDTKWDDFVKILRDQSASTLRIRLHRSPSPKTGRMIASCTLEREYPRKAYRRELIAAARKAAKEGY